jgi:rubrerythrin
MAHTGTPDPVYDLISVAYHALQGAETYEQYAEDAQAQGAQELADYFRKTQEHCRRSADEAQRLLASRLQQAAISASA